MCTMIVYVAVDLITVTNGDTLLWTLYSLDLTPGGVLQILPTCNHYLDGLFLEVVDRVQSPRRLREVDAAKQGLLLPLDCYSDALASRTRSLRTFSTRPQPHFDTETAAGLLLQLTVEK